MTVTILALAESSGNFTATGTSTAAIFNIGAGSFGGVTLSGTNQTSFTTSILPPNGQNTSTNADRPSGDVSGTTGACMASANTLFI